MARRAVVGFVLAQLEALEREALRHADAEVVEEVRRLRAWLRLELQSPGLRSAERDALRVVRRRPWLVP